MQEETSGKRVQHAWGGKEQRKTSVRGMVCGWRWGWWAGRGGAGC